MKKASLLLIFLTIISLNTRAQIVLPDGYEVVDSLVFTPSSQIDSSMIGNIFGMMPDNVSLSQSRDVREAVEQKIARNSSITQRGYRIRIYFDNKQVSRNESEAIARRFRMQYPGVNVYRSFVSPFFKVTVGDFRTKSEALAALAEYKKDFESAFLVRENLRFPSVGDANFYRVDTIKVIRKIEEY